MFGTYWSFSVPVLGKIAHIFHYTLKHYINGTIEYYYFLHLLLVYLVQWHLHNLTLLQICARSICFVTESNQRTTSLMAQRTKSLVDIYCVLHNVFHAVVTKVAYQTWFPTQSHYTDIGPIQMLTLCCNFLQNFASCHLRTVLIHDCKVLLFL